MSKCKQSFCFIRLLPPPDHMAHPPSTAPSRKTSYLILDMHGLTSGSFLDLMTREKRKESEEGGQEEEEVVSGENGK